MTPAGTLETYYSVVASTGSVQREARRRRGVGNQIVG